MIIKINNIAYHPPTSWNALVTHDVKKALRCYAILMANTHGALQPEETLPWKRIELLKELLGLSDEFLLDWEKDCVAVEGPEDGQDVYLQELQQVAQAVTAFFFEQVATEEGEAKQYRMAFTLTQCPIAKLLWTGRKTSSKKKSLASTS